jgi:hypothetical protein
MQSRCKGAKVQMGCRCGAEQVRHSRCRAGAEQSRAEQVQLQVQRCSAGAVQVQVQRYRGTEVQRWRRFGAESMLRFSRGDCAGYCAVAEEQLAHPKCGSGAWHTHRAGLACQERSVSDVCYT